VTARGILAAGASLGAAWAAWIACGWVVASAGLPFAALLQQAVLFVLALTLAERGLARFASSGDSHG
jgi:hypothetical protein